MDMSTSVKKNIQTWLDGPYDEETKNEIKKLLKENPHELIGSFSKTLDFGTGGIREKMGVGTNRLNKYTVAIATQGLANYIKKSKTKKPSVIIGFDSRKNSKTFATEAAKVLAANDILVYLFDELRPTPLVSFGCRYKECTAAIMITASHNPPEYNGYKVYWSDGGQVLPPHDVGIIEEYKEIKDFKNVKMVDDLNHKNIKIIKDEIDNIYMERLFSMDLFKEKTIKNLNLKIIYSSLHGCGITLVPKCIKKAGYENFLVVKEQKDPDPKFTNAKKPNPEEKLALEIGIRYLLENKADIFIATDPDADRMGVVALHKNESYILSGNQIACIILDYLCQNSLLTSKAAAVKSIVTTELMQRICEFYDVNLFDVLTGFKYIAEKINEWQKDNSYNFLFGAEESLGYLIETFSRDKDAISASLLICKIAQKAKENNKTLVDLLYDIYQKHGLYRQKLASISFDSLDGMEKMKHIMEKLRSHPLNVIGNIEVHFIDDYKLGKTFSLKDKKQSMLSLPESNVIRYWLSDNSKLVIRPSGTEPKIKIYAEVQEVNIKDINSDIKKLDERLDSLIDAIKLEIS
ncbi:MAG: phospho-sugar mutase [Parachlamydiales bacterium]|nr:phospho-sugar mutase [Parachlamydiales bacterium]